jgi:hypothetical protein
LALFVANRWPPAAAAGNAPDFQPSLNHLSIVVFEVLAGFSAVRFSDDAAIRRQIADAGCE